MGLIETLILMFDGCIGFLEVLTLIVDGLAIYFCTRTYQTYKKGADLKAHRRHGQEHGNKASWRPLALVFMAAFAVGLTFLTLYKYLYMEH